MNLNDDLRQLLNYAFFYLKFRPRSKKEIKDYLDKKIQKRHWSRTDVDQVIKYLEELQMIDDKNFIRWFVDQRILLKPKSEFVLRRELMQHGVAKDLIDEYFSENEMNEEELALNILKIRWHRFKSLDKRTRFGKAASFLMRRGFNYDIIKTVIEKLEST